MWCVAVATYLTAPRELKIGEMAKETGCYLATISRMLQRSRPCSNPEIGMLEKAAN